MHEAAFELIEIPHVRQSGKNSADIRMVVDALDLCYTKAHVDTFVIISGDSDFSPLVSKLRENNKIVIGVGVKNSTLGPADRQLRRVHLLRRPGAHEAAAQAAAAQAARGRRPGRGRRRRPPRRTRPQRKQPGGAGPDHGDLRGPGRGARGGGEDLGLDDQADPQAPQAGLQRVLLRLPLLQHPARGRRQRAACWTWSATRNPAASSSAGSTATSRTHLKMRLTAAGGVAARLNLLAIPGAYAARSRLTAPCLWLSLFRRRVLVGL